MYSCTVPLEVVFAAERAFTTTMRAHILLHSVWVVSVHVCLEIERTRKR